MNYLKQAITIVGAVITTTQAIHYESVRQPVTPALRPIIENTVAAIASDVYSPIKNEHVQVDTQKRPTNNNVPLEPPLVGIMPGKDKPRIVLAQDIHYPPYATLDEEDLTLSGFAIELAKGIEAMAPDEIEFVFSETKW